jgi:nucleotide-binding universal stress UspA family protein
VSFTNGWDPQSEAEKVLIESIEPVRHAYPDIEIRTRVVEGHPAPVLVEASRGAELLIVGSRGHGEFAGMLPGVG